MAGILFSLILSIAVLVDSCSRFEGIVIVENKRGERVAVGEVTAEAILDSFPDFRKNYEGYVVDQESLGNLRSLERDLEIFTVLGTWCKDSRREVPKFLKIMDALDSKKVHLRFLSVDRTKRDEGGIAESFDIRYVPTFILLEDGQEIGRIVETPKKTIEVDLVNILQK